MVSVSPPVHFLPGKQKKRIFKAATIRFNFKESVANLTFFTTVYTFIDRSEIYYNVFSQDLSLLANSSYLKKLYISSNKVNFTFGTSSCMLLYKFVF